ncbi:serine/arginine repetitive matrix protein 2-like [Cervus canadensis]|uniref:serine/arginine repetitive matrix protein 2-like n=1 Tax=Cervus canadensis TaxID=1574408 RepID=UPI001C9E22F9|nr:serine/arginine repetitive matrix protein 2-like [Cervus canadensis]
MRPGEGLCKGPQSREDNATSNHGGPHDPGHGPASLKVSLIHYRSIDWSLRGGRRDGVQGYLEPVPLAETRSRLQPLLAADPVQWSAPAPGRLPPLCKGRAELGKPCTLVFLELQTRSPVPSLASQRLPLGCAGLPPSSPAAGARTPGLRHVGAREAAAAAAAAGAQARAPAGEITLHAAGSAAVFRSASGRSPAPRASEAAEGRTRTGGGARRAGASRALSKGRPQPGGGSRALSLALCSSRCRGFQAARRRCALSRRRPAEVSRSRPPFRRRVPVYPGGRARPPELKRARSLKSAPSAANFPGSPSPRCSLRQPWERCAPSRAARPLPTRHSWDPLPSTAPLGARSLRRVARERSETPRRFADSARARGSAEVSCGAASIPRGPLLKQLFKSVLDFLETSVFLGVKSSRYQNMIIISHWTTVSEVAVQYQIKKDKSNWRICN